MTGEHTDRGGDPHFVETERLLVGLSFAPRESLGAEIAGRVRRGEMPHGRPQPSRSAVLRSTLGLAAALTMAVSAGVLSWKSMGPPVLIDSCCQDLDGGGIPDDGFVLEARGRQVRRLRLYEDRDGSRSLSSGDLVRFARGPVPAVSGDRDARTTRICCADLDGEGPADDGVLIMSEADESIVLAAVYEQRSRGVAAPLR
jgi:hypothetical protein